MENKAERLIVRHERNGMTGQQELQLVGLDDKIILIIDQDDFEALECAQLHPYMYEDLITYAFHLQPEALKGYSREKFYVMWSEENTSELKTEWDIAIEIYNEARGEASADAIGFTPAPWKSQQWGQDFICKGAKGQRVFSIRDGVLPVSPDRWLIDASPVMYKALKAAKVLLDDNSSADAEGDNRVLVVTLSQINDAIALAEGRDIE